MERIKAVDWDRDKATGILSVTTVFSTCKMEHKIVSSSAHAVDYINKNLARFKGYRVKVYDEDADTYLFNEVLTEQLSYFIW